MFSYNNTDYYRSTCHWKYFRVKIGNQTPLQYRVVLYGMVMEKGDTAELQIGSYSPSNLMTSNNDLFKVKLLIEFSCCENLS